MVATRSRSQVESWTPEGLVKMQSKPLPARLTYPKPSLLVVGGMPGVGKSTLLKTLKTDALIISPEDVAERHGTKVVSPKNSLLLSKEVERALRDGRSVIIDAPALWPHLRNEYSCLALCEEVPANFLFLHEPQYKAKSGQRERKRTIEKESMQRYGRLQKEMFATWEDGYLEEYDSVVVTNRKGCQSLQEISFA